MTLREAERRLRLIEGTALARRPDPDSSATELERWAASLTVEALERCEMLCRAMADDQDRVDGPMSDFERDLIAVCCTDADYGTTDDVRRAYLMNRPHDPSEPAMFELRLRIDRWLTDPDRAFMRGTDVHGFLRWHGVNVDALSAGELVRLAALLRVFEEHPREAASLTTDALWCTVRDYGCRGRHALASVGVA